MKTIVGTQKISPQTAYATDETIHTLVAREQHRQQTQISCIASENYAPADVQALTGSVLTNKYAEGYPGKRYYAGCAIIDEIETLAIERCKQLFGVDHANVQPHSGSQANFAAYHALLRPGDTIMGMSLAAGGHLTHGHGVNASGSVYKSVSYGVDPVTELIDYDAIETLAHEHKPKLIIAGASAYSRTIDFARFAAIARSCNSLLLADIAHIAGLIAARLHPSPVGHATMITSTTHKTLRGPRGGLIMCSAEWAKQLDQAIIPGTQGGPLLHVIAAKATGFFHALQPSFVDYQRNVILNARTMAQEFKQRGYRVVADGTDNHMFTLDLRTKNITGLAAERALEKAGITVSRSCIPNDPQKPWITSGIRIGTPALTTRGMDTTAALALVDLIDEALQHANDDALLHRIAGKVAALCAQFPIPE